MTDMEMGSPDGSEPSALTAILIVRIGHREYEVGKTEGSTARELNAGVARVLHRIAEEVESGAREFVAEHPSGAPVDAFSVCTCNAENETKCSACGRCSRCHGLCDCEVHPGTRCADCEADEDHCSCEDGFNPTSTGGDE